ncbi:uncharacterized protein LOC103705616 isoform X2 [Phoenix dactylifera]|uniref:Uncharacterized protein LOC103705616 isoform X2 n=1 Tax=Phoenix dactylifera TaxID=42345 RepID=A0A8B7MUG9_PHODC|nr:uncharacterized protein LOC103705616 isoform X2 [Phoenix dactylifera]
MLVSCDGKLRSIEQAAADDDEEANKCEHFTIRGYVAKVRRRNAKVFWPLLSHHNQTSGELASSLPPLPVTKFRWWNCKKCLSEISTPKDLITDGAVTNVQNDEVNTCKTSFLINTDATNLLSGFQQPSEEKILDGRLVQTDSSVNVSNGECSPSLCLDKKKNASTSHGLTKEGLQIPKGGLDISEEIQNQSRKPTIFAAEPTVAPKEYEMPLGIDISIPKADALAAISAHMSDHDSMRLNKRHTKASDCSMGLPNYVNENQDPSSQLGNSSGRFHHKKSRKVRLLDDIIRSEELCASKKVHIFSGDTDTSQIKHDNDTRPDTSNWKLKHPDNQSHLATRNIQETPTMETSQNEDEENSLMDWLKKVSRKAVGHKEHSENKHIDAAVGISSGSSSGKGPNRYKLQSALEKENKMRPLKPGWPCLVPQQDIFNAEDVSTRLLNAKIDNNKSTGCIVSKKSLHRGPEIPEGTNTKAILTNKKNKATPVEDRLKVKKKAIKKQKTTNICVQEGLDGIPMDIVELLAKHQHERHLMSAGVAAENMYNLSEMTGNMRDDCRLKACDSFNFRKQNLHIDLNQQPTEFLELSQCSGDPLSRLEHPVTVSNDTDGTSVPLNGTAFENISRKHYADFNSVNVVSHDSCLDQSLKTVDQKIDCHDLHDSKFTSFQLLLGKEKAKSSISVCPDLAGNGCHSRTIEPLDLHANETISALHLLRLMDRTAGLGASNTNQSRSVLESYLNCTDQFKELQGLEFGFGTKEMPNHPRGAGYSDQDQHQGNSSKPLHPVPIISVLGSLLHKEIVTKSNYCQILQGFQARHPNDLPLHSIIKKVKTDASYSAIQSEVRKTMTSMYMGVNSKEIFSGLDPVAHSSLSLARYEIDQAGTSNRDRAVQTLRSHCEFGNCVVNRNPADFATPDEDEYMVGSNDPRTRYIYPSPKSLLYQTHPDGREQQLVMKLTALKGL